MNVPILAFYLKQTNNNPLLVNLWDLKKAGKFILFPFEKKLTQYLFIYTLLSFAFPELYGFIIIILL